ncbi:hypothetical protein QEN19_003151 [Hanseniaspora menglaensis]
MSLNKAKISLYKISEVDSPINIDSSTNNKRKFYNKETTSSKRLKTNTKYNMKDLVLPEFSLTRFCYRHNPNYHQPNNQDFQKDEDNLKDNINSSLRVNDNQKDTVENFIKIFTKQEGGSIGGHDKNMILKILMNSLCSPQLSFISETCQALIKLDFISTLPKEISLKILQYLDCQSLCVASQVCKKWQMLANDDTVWYFMCLQHIDKKCEKCGWGLPLLQMKNRRYIQESKNSGDDTHRRDLLRDINIIPFAGNSSPNSKNITEENAVNAGFQMRTWKTVYKERYSVEKNWRTGNFKTLNFRGHLDSILTLKMQFNLLFTGSYDNTIAIWNLPQLIKASTVTDKTLSKAEKQKINNTPQLLRRLTGHQDAIKAISFNGTTLITGSLDKTIKIWNFQTGQCISTYRGHTDSVLSIDSNKSIIVSGSADKTVRVWHVDLRTCFTLKGHSDWVNCVKLDYESMTCFSCSDDHTIKMWDIKENRLMKTFKGHVGQVQKIVLLHLASDVNLTSDLDDCCPEVNSNIIEECDKVDTEKNCDSEREFKYPTHIVSCSLDSTIKIWDVKTGRCIRTQFGHVGGVWDIECDNFRIISCSRDRYTKVWDLQNGKLILNFNDNDQKQNENQNNNPSTNGAIKNCLDLGDSEFITGDDAGFIKLYNFNI